MSSSQKGKEEASHDWKTHLIPSFQPELDDILKRLGVSGPSSGSTAPLPSEADKLLEPSPETVDRCRRVLGSPSRVPDSTSKQQQPEIRIFQRDKDENAVIMGQVALSFMTNQTRQLLTLREMLKDLRPHMEDLGIRGKAWHDFEDLFLSSDPQEAARTYDIIMERLPRDQSSAVPSSRPQ